MYEQAMTQDIKMEGVKGSLSPHCKRHVSQMDMCSLKDILVTVTKTQLSHFEQFEKILRTQREKNIILGCSFQHQRSGSLVAMQLTCKFYRINDSASCMSSCMLGRTNGCKFSKENILEVILYVIIVYSFMKLFGNKLQ